MCAGPLSKGVDCCSIAAAARRAIPCRSRRAHLTREKSVTALHPPLLVPACFCPRKQARTRARLRAGKTKTWRV